MVSNLSNLRVGTCLLVVGFCAWAVGFCFLNFVGFVFFSVGFEVSLVLFCWCVCVCVCVKGNELIIKN